MLSCVVFKPVIVVACLHTKVKPIWAMKGNSNRDEVKDVVSRVISHFVKIDILLNNAAAIDHVAKFEDQDDRLWERDLNVNITGVYNCCKAVWPHMKINGGRIINMSSIVGTIGGYGMLYCYKLGHVQGLHQLTERVHYFDAQIAAQMSIGFGRRGHSDDHHELCPAPTGGLPYEDHVLEGPPERTRRLKSCGRQTFFPKVRVVTVDGRDVRPGEVGEIIARGKNIMLGYWKNPELTAETLKDGYNGIQEPPPESAGAIAGNSSFCWGGRDDSYTFGNRSVLTGKALCLS